MKDEPSKLYWNTESLSIAFEFKDKILKDLLLSHINFSVVSAMRAALVKMLLNWTLDLLSDIPAITNMNKKSNKNFVKDDLLNKYYLEINRPSTEKWKLLNCSSLIYLDIIIKIKQLLYFLYLKKFKKQKELSTSLDVARLFSFFPWNNWLGVALCFNNNFNISKLFDSHTKWIGFFPLIAPIFGSALFVRKYLTNNQSLTSQAR